MHQVCAEIEVATKMANYVTNVMITHMGTIEKKYDRDFGVRSDKELGNFLKENKIDSLNDLIKSDLGKKK